MVFIVVFALVVALICAVSVWPRVGALPLAAQPWRATAPELDAGWEPADDPGSAEGVLATRLIAGDITHRQYADAMERLAG